MKIDFSSGFKKSYKKLLARRPDSAIIILEKILLFSQDPRNPVLKLHKLKGELKEVWSLRILVEFPEENVAYFMVIGTYDEVY